MDAGIYLTEKSLEQIFKEIIREVKKAKREQKKHYSLWDALTDKRRKAKREAL